MYIMKKYHLFPFILLVLLAACTSGTDELAEVSIPVEESIVNFKASFNRTSRATETAFEYGDAISVFAVNPMEDIKLKESGNYADNMKYTYYGNSFEAENDAVTISADNKIGLGYYAIYPYMISASNNFIFAVKTNQSTHINYTQSDFCTSYVSPTVDKTVNLGFTHRLSNIEIDFQGDNLMNKDIKVQLENVYTSCKVDINNNTCQAIGSKDNVVMGEESNNAFQAIIVPQTLTTDSKFIKVTLDNKDFYFKLLTNKTIKSGCTYSFSFNVEKNVVKAVSEGIVNWEDEYVTPDSEKKLAEITIVRSYGISTGTFIYDNSGRIVSCKGTEEEDGNKINYTYTYNWEGNRCIQICDINEDQNMCYTFENNMMKTSTWGPWTQTFTYNNDKQLIRIDHSFSDGELPDFETFIWEDGKLIEGGDDVTLSYSNQKFNGFNPAIYLFANDIIEDVPLALPHPELVGLKMNHLVNRISGEWSIWDLSYTFNEDGYISSCTVTETETNGDVDVEVYTFEWE